MTVKIKITHKMSLHGENRSYHFEEFPYNLTLTLCVRNAFLGSEIALLNHFDTVILFHCTDLFNLFILQFT